VRIPAKLTAVIAVALTCASAEIATGQRIRFPASQPGVTFAAGTGGGTYGAPQTFSGSTTVAPPNAQFGVAPPGYDSSATTQPGASFQGTIAPAPGWDPYANPSGPTFNPPPGSAPVVTGPPALFPDGITSPFEPGTYNFNQADGTIGGYQRFFKRSALEHTWLVGDAQPDNSEFEMHSSEVNGTVVFAFLYNRAPLEVTPGFALHLLEGPARAPGPGSPDLPAQLYDAYLDSAWRPQITPWLSADLGVRIGVYTDLQHTTSDSIRIMGRGLAILNLSQRWQVAGGVVYFDRLNLKLLPAGGVIWTPNPDTRFEIVFPRPKLTRRFSTIGTVDFSWVISGEYGGGSWTVQQAMVSDRIDYNDIRVSGGIEWASLSGLRGSIEAGYVFDREIIFDSPATPDFKPSDTFMLRGGLTY